MGINLGDEFPDFEADTTNGKISFHDWINDSWCIFFSHPNDFTPVCTTELARVTELMPEFQERKVKVIALSCNSIESHVEWIKDILSCSSFSEGKFPYPIISDPNRELAVKLGMLDPDEKDSSGLPLTCRAVFIIDPKKKLRLSILYPATTGRNFKEVLRVIDSLMLTDNNKVATPVDWKNGDDCMILPSIPQKDVSKLFPKGCKIIQVPSKKEYMRITPQP
ncbi:Peroxiredoxin-6, putative [Pediculus humanus corporis]|uniref:1-Cys peroxiredoxin n=1 Tax=Pediculus humanus subsp. corporis TaxID=121224 RepID=E0VEQ3_PEDHC|nr:Peroxiredoxin-6, putative [Pediculus humanus corporis]EEB11859.1 Peroxiredoxin-6, putative [Pediculus humanus corporis]